MKTDGLLIPVLIATLTTSAVVEANDECLDCHRPGADGSSLEMNLQVEADSWSRSVHAELGFGCSDCHYGQATFPHEDGASPARCSDCHSGVMEELEGSLHGESLARTEGPSPFPDGSPCIVCHGVHDVLSTDNPDSPVNHGNIPESCGLCHGNTDIALAYGLSLSPAENYPMSVHGQHAAGQDRDAATCTDCHGAHDIRPAFSSESMINPFNIPETCGRCHPEAAEEYGSSVHGTAFRRGVSASPLCIDCHGIHSIKRIPGAASDDEDRHLVRATCAACHDSEALMSEYGVEASRVGTYEASYHGLANQSGSSNVADCAACHGVHAIYASIDERSSVAPQNLQETCRGCHTGASVEFSRSPVHFTAEGESADVVITIWVKRIYWTLIFVVLGGMVLHNLVILTSHLRRKMRRESSEPSRRRFTTSQIIQHAVLVLTFAVLVISGFMLAYPEASWSRFLMQLGVTESIRRWTHRIAAICLIAASLYHLGWLLLTRYGRAELGRIRPRFRDIAELRQNMSFHLGFSNKKPRFAKYDYPAKIEYWSLVWGTAIMALTGLVLWFPVVATSFLPYWTVQVSEVVHLFEAWLATLAILLFHFFYVFGHPDSYPLNLAMFHGKMDKESSAEHHPDWTDD